MSVKKKKLSGCQFHFFQRLVAHIETIGWSGILSGITQGNTGNALDQRAIPYK